MRAILGCLALFSLAVSPARGSGLLIPTDKAVPPLAMVRHDVAVTIEDQAAVTRVEQTFRNHTGTALEATYVFPVPRGASVSRFSMWLDGKEVKGELMDAGKARAVYSAAVQRTLDPGLLEYIGNDLFQLKVPVAARKDLKVALSFTSELQRDGNVVEYLYPLKSNAKASQALEKFHLEVTLKARQGVQNIYSPTHGVTIRRANDHEATVVFQHQPTLLHRDFRLLYVAGTKDVGVAVLTHKPAGAAKGHFMLLLSPRAELPKEHVQPRDLVLVLDTSGSMLGTSIQQARNALKFVLDRLDPRDRFGLITFSDSVNVYGQGLWDGSTDNVTRAKTWVDGIEANGGTNINDALLAALDMRPASADRAFTIMFFTDGQPTIGVQDPQQIVKNFLAKNTANTRLFTFGVGHDVNATLLDQLALRTGAASAYVRPGEDIETRASSLYGKIRHPVLVNLKLGVDKAVVLEDLAPPKIPDLFHGGQVMVLGRYTGHGKVKVTLEGDLGKEKRVFEYTVDFPEQTSGAGRDMVPFIWARRKVGFLLDQIRERGESKELIDSIVSLAKTYGIATPYTSYLIVPDGKLPNVAFDGVAAALSPPVTGKLKASPTSHVSGIQTWAPRGGTGMQIGGFGMQMGGFQMGGLQMGMQMGGLGFGGGMPTGWTQMGSPGMMMGGMQMGGMQMGGLGMPQPGGMMGMGGGGMLGMSGAGVAHSNTMQLKGKMNVADWARLVQARPGALSDERGRLLAGATSADGASQEKSTLDQARQALASKRHSQTQVGQLGVDLSVQSNQLRDETRIVMTAQRKVAGRVLLEVGGVWIDEAFDPKMPAVVIKAFSPAYFRLVESQPDLRELLKLGSALVWVTPNGSALIIDPQQGSEEWNEAEMTKLFKTRPRDEVLPK